MPRNNYLKINSNRASYKQIAIQSIGKENSNLYKKNIFSFTKGVISSISGNIS